MSDGRACPILNPFDQSVSLFCSLFIFLKYLLFVVFTLVGECKITNKQHDGSRNENVSFFFFVLEFVTSPNEMLPFPGKQKPPGISKCFSWSKVLETEVFIIEIPCHFSALCYQYMKISLTLNYQVTQSAPLPPLSHTQINILLFFLCDLLHTPV